MSELVSGGKTWLFIGDTLMGVVTSIDHSAFPKQGRWLGKKTMVSFKYDRSHQIGGVFVRDDAEHPGVSIIRLDDGRYVLTTECQHSVPV